MLLPSRSRSFLGRITGRSSRQPTAGDRPRSDRGAWLVEVLEERVLLSKGHGGPELLDDHDILGVEAAPLLKQQVVQVKVADLVADGLGGVIQGLPVQDGQVQATRTGDVLQIGTAFFQFASGQGYPLVPVSGPALPRDIGVPRAPAPVLLPLSETASAIVPTSPSPGAIAVSAVASPSSPMAATPAEGFAVAVASPVAAVASGVVAATLPPAGEVVAAPPALTSPAASASTAASVASPAPAVSASVLNESSEAPSPAAPSPAVVRDAASAAAAPPAVIVAAPVVTAAAGNASETTPTSNTPTPTPAAATTSLEPAQRAVDGNTVDRGADPAATDGEPAAAPVVVAAPTVASGSPATSPATAPSAAVAGSTLLLAPVLPPAPTAPAVGRDQGDGQADTSPAARVDLAVAAIAAPIPLADEAIPAEGDELGALRLPGPSGETVDTAEVPVDEVVRPVESPAEEEDGQASERVKLIRKLAPIIVGAVACLTWGNYLHSGGMAGRRETREQDEATEPASEV